ncbi:uncharacterized protein LOC118449661 [Vespa mandarinia]|uniref:uncharacterized protein LOC118449661 n=1 Tax=Vespa mandarinia TaxID=7446 RepID=UPI001613D59F|nr:uncharacterized protein LOC118449661 [Vespa mandarinia]
MNNERCPNNRTSLGRWKEAKRLLLPREKLTTTTGTYDYHHHQSSPTSTIGNNSRAVESYQHQPALTPEYTSTTSITIITIDREGFSSSASFIVANGMCSSSFLIALDSSTFALTSIEMALSSDVAFMHPPRSMRRRRGQRCASTQHHHGYTRWLERRTRGRFLVLLASNATFSGRAQRAREERQEEQHREQRQDRRRTQRGADCRGSGTQRDTAACTLVARAKVKSAYRLKVYGVIRQ